MATQTRVRFLASDIWDAPEDRNIYEVIDGELYVTPAPGWWHQNAVSVLLAVISSYIRPRKLGKIVPAPTGVVLDDHNGLESDLIYISQERAGIITERGVEGAPGLVVEVLSPSTAVRDRGIKMRRYAAAGIPNYWIVDPANRTLEAYRLGAAGYEFAAVHGPGDVFRPELFPGLEIPIDELFA